MSSYASSFRRRHGADGGDSDRRDEFQPSEHRDGCPAGQTLSPPISPPRPPLMVTEEPLVPILGVVEQLGEGRGSLPLSQVRIVDL